MKDYKIETITVHAGVEPDPTTGAVMTPIYQTSTYIQDGVGNHKGYEYSRTGNPTRAALEKALAGLEGGRHALAFSSGMAALDTLMKLFSAGDHIICGNDVYGGTFRLFDKVLSRFGLDFSYVETTNVAEVEAALRPNSKMIWLETPTNPTLKISDIEAVVAIAKKAGVKVGVDNTFASPILQRPLEMGADFVLHSTTKYIGGHSDVVGGAVVLNDEADYERLKFLQNAAGAIPGPQDCFLTLRGIKTLALRMKQHCHNATHVARFLSDHPAVSQVIYPGLEDHPQHHIAKKQMSGPGGMISFILFEGEAAALNLVKHTELFALAESLGGVESLIELPAQMTHAAVADSSLAIDPGLIRISVGIENHEDLIQDLQQALRKTV